MLSLSLPKKNLNELAQFYHKLLLSEVGMPGLKYLKNRGLIDDIISSMQIGYAISGYFKDRIVFPVKDKNNEVVFFTSRAVDSQNPIKHKHGVGKMSWLYNEPLLSKISDYVILCEAPFDCLTLIQAGYNAIAAMGIYNFNRGKAEKLTKIKRIYICFDNDINSAGQKGAQRAGEILAKLGLSVWNIQIPFILGPDINDMYLKNTKYFNDEFKKILQKASPIIPKIEPRKTTLIKTGKQFPILPIAEKYIDYLIPMGANRYRAICPFHNETKPSFYIDANSNLFKCFGCNRGGNTIKFIQLIKAKMGITISHKEAISILEGCHET